MLILTVVLCVSSVATEGSVFRWDKEWESVHGLNLPDGSVIYGDFNPNRNLFRIFDAVRLGKEKLDDFDYDERLISSVVSL